MSDPTLHLKRDQLRPEVRSYIDNLKAQVQQLLREQGVKDTKEFERLVAEKKVGVEVVQRLKDLLEKFARTARTGEAAEETERRRELAEELIESALHESDQIRDSERRMATKLATVKAASEADLRCPGGLIGVSAGIATVRENDRRALLYLQLADVHALINLGSVVDDDLNEARYALTFIKDDTNSKFLTLFKIAETTQRLGRDPTQVIDQLERAAQAIQRGPRVDDLARRAVLAAKMGKDPDEFIFPARQIHRETAQQRFDDSLALAKAEQSLGRDYLPALGVAIAMTRKTSPDIQADNWGDLALFLAKAGALTDDILREGYASLIHFSDSGKRVKEAIKLDYAALRSGRAPEKIWQGALERELGEHLETLVSYAAVFAWELAGKKDVSDYLAVIEANRKAYAVKQEQLIFITALEAVLQAFEGKDPRPGFETAENLLVDADREREDAVRHDLCLLQSVAAGALVGRPKPELIELPLLTGF